MTVVAYAQADPNTLATPNGSDAQKAATYFSASGAANQPGVAIYGGWQFDQAGATSATLSALNAADASAAGSLAPTGLTNREIVTSAPSFALDAATSLPGTLALNASGSVTQSAGITANALLLEGGGSFALTGSNTIATLAATGGTIDVATAGAVTVGAVSDVKGATTAGITATGPVTLASGGAQTLAANGTITSADSIILVTADRFINEDGSNALQVTGGGRWLVYSQTPANDTLDGLVDAFKQYDAPYNTTPAQAAGDGFLYAIAPTISLVGVTKTYDGGTTASFVPGDYTISGVIDGDTVALSGASGSFATRTAGTGIQVTFGSPAITSATNGSATVYGYNLAALSPQNTIGTINPEPITVTAAANTKTYDA